MKLLVAALCLCVSTSAAAQDALGPARQLYASADYEGALTALEGVNGGEGAMEVDKYRVLCLVALGRSAEADTVIAQMLTSNPLYELAAGDAPPRIRAAFSRVRGRVLPSIARASYEAGKTAFDEKDFGRAATKLEEVVRILEGEANGDLADLLRLAKGFLELSRASMPARPVPAAPAVAETPTPATVPVTRPDSDPVAVSQVLPPWSSTGLGALSRIEYRGVIEIDIDENGRVVGAKITRPIHPLYDPALLKASEGWTYLPAYRDGKPVPIRKRVDIVLQPK